MFLITGRVAHQSEGVLTRLTEIKKAKGEGGGVVASRAVREWERRIAKAVVSYREHFLWNGTEARCVETLRSCRNTLR